MKSEHNQMAWATWHVAALQRAKRMPRLKDMMHGAKPVRRRQSVDEMIRIAEQWTAALARRR